MNNRSVTYQYESPVDRSIHPFILTIVKDKVTCIQPDENSLFLKPFLCEFQHSSEYDLFSIQQNLPIMALLGYIQGCEKLSKISPSNYTHNVRNILFNLENIIFNYESLLGFSAYLNYNKLFQLLQNTTGYLGALRDQISKEPNLEKWIITGGLSAPLKTGFLEKLSQSISEIKKRTDKSTRLIFNSSILKNRLKIKNSPGCKFDNKTKAPLPYLATSNIAHQLENRITLIFFHLSRLEQSKDTILLRDRPIYSQPQTIIFPDHSEKLNFETTAGTATLNMVKKKEKFLIKIDYPFVKFWERINHLVLDIPVEDIDLFICSIFPALRGYYQ